MLSINCCLNWLWSRWFHAGEKKMTYHGQKAKFWDLPHRNLLQIPPVKLVRYGRRCSSFVAPSLWNFLSVDIRQSSSLMEFKAHIIWKRTFLINVIILESDIILIWIFTVIINPLIPGAFRQKCIFWTFWRFSAWKWAKLAPIYSNRHLQHDGMSFFRVAPRFTTFLLEHAQKSTFGHERDLRLDFSCFFLFSFVVFLQPLLIFLLQWLTLYWACFQFKKFWESIIETVKFQHGVATCSRRQFGAEFFAQIS